MSAVGAALSATAPLVGAALGGLYLAFDLAVLPALRGATRGAPSGGGTSVDPAATMREINVAIVRPAFLVLLVGAPALAVAAAVAEPAVTTVAAAALQVTGLVITLAVNVPRNEALARGGSFADFVRPWTRAHRARGAAALLGAVVGTV